MQSVPITIEIVSRSGDVYLIQRYVIRFLSDFQQVGGFLRAFPIFSIKKADRHDITEKLLKVALNTINPNTLLSNRWCLVAYGRMFRMRIRGDG